MPNYAHVVHFLKLVYVNLLAVEHKPNILLYTIYYTSVVWKETALNYKWDFFSSSDFNSWNDLEQVSKFC